MPLGAFFVGYRIKSGKNMSLRAVLGRKFNMARIYDKHGRSVPVTYVKTGPLTIVEVKTKEKQGYDVSVVGFENTKKISKGVSGRLRKLGIKEDFRFLKELPSKSEAKAGEVVTVGDVFRVGDLVDVRGVSKGKGFAGVVKRYGFKGGPRTHGQSDRERAPGSIGSTTTPGRVYKGTRMAGHMGKEQVTVQGLEILSIDKENNLLGIKGALPGNREGLLIIEKSLKRKKAYHEPEIPQIPIIGGGAEEPKEELTEGAVPVGEQTPAEPVAEVKPEGVEENA